MAQAHAGDEEHAEERGDVDDGGAEIRLDEDEHRGHGRIRDAEDDEAERPDAPRIARDQRRQGQQQRELAELRRLELEERELDPAPRPACREAEREDGRDERDRADVERPLEAPETLDVDERQHAQRERAQSQVDLLLDHEGVAPGARADDVEAESSHARQRRQHQPVEAADAPQYPDAPRAPHFSRTHALAGYENARHQVDWSTTVLRFGLGVLNTLE